MNAVTSTAIVNQPKLHPSLISRQTPYAGTGIFANSLIPASTLLLATTEGPVCHVIYRRYRKEVCAFCFKYNVGRSWKVKVGQLTAVVFCAEECAERWRELTDEPGLEFMARAENLVMANAKKTSAKSNDANPNVAAQENDKRPLSRGIVEDTWAGAEATARQLRKFTVEGNRKGRNRVETLIYALPVVPDTLYFLLSGLLFIHRGIAQDDAFHQLCEEAMPYANAADLQAHADSYLQLLLIAPDVFLDAVTPDNIRRLAGVASHNAFGIRSIDNSRDLGYTSAEPEVEEPGSELLGWSVYPEASFFNHSCTPNVRKVRDGRVWQFWSSREIIPDEEVCITYLGGDERTMSKKERCEILQMFWAFECRCARCMVEE